ncbi:LysR family transcriptional regulator [Streptacidiphilus pinicola]|uniref:LysR family transcriptional regulator n=1 Tax=Streptacidiphilus pinicola TaxID=2219663 RepID=A0A2X0IA02_9ACTN|nr:LysR family transcriptional regulator [Streptacidiphilus pinicola]RAG81802.1 LysR family transcriptional regulator [Streptacidiphilus pinicola]
MLNLERLRILDAVARHGSVTGAADGLHITTSAISQQLAKLEREAGQRLLAKHGRGIRLTDAGLLLAEHAAGILAQVERARADLEAQRGEVVGELRIGAFPTAVRGLLPKAVTTLRAAHPELRVRVQESEPEGCVRKLVRGDLDLGIFVDWSNRPFALPAGLLKAPLMSDTVDLAVPADHPLADRAEVGLADFAEDEWICWREGEFCYDWLVFTMRAMDIEPRIVHHAEEHETQLALVAAGLGVAVLPRLGRGPAPAGVRLLPVRRSIQRHLYATWRADLDSRPAIRAALTALTAAASTAAGGRTA